MTRLQVWRFWTALAVGSMAMLLTFSLSEYRGALNYPLVAMTIFAVVMMLRTR